MKKIMYGVMGLLILSLIGTFIFLIECVYPLGEFIQYWFGDFGMFIGKVFGTITLLGDALWIAIIIYSLWTETFDKFLNK